MACQVIGAGGYLLLVITALYTQPTIISSPEGLTTTPPAGLPNENVIIQTVDGVRLSGWWMEMPSAQRTILYIMSNRRHTADHRQG